MQAQVSGMTPINLNLGIRNALLYDISDHLDQVVLVRFQVFQYLLHDVVELNYLVM